jgi:flavin-dependent dehydrogenase
MAILDADSFVLGDGAKIAVIGGGPTGSFFSIFALKMAKMIGKEIQVTIFDPKDFSKDGPRGCNHCGGIISELLVQSLAVEGINLPDSVVQRGINSYNLHTEHGSVYIATPALEKTIATVYRGGGPRGIIGSQKESFDNFLLGHAVEEGAVHVQQKVDKIELRKGRPVIFSEGQELLEADLVVGAFGINSPTTKVFEDIGFGYRKPESTTTAIAEIGMDRSVLSEHFGNSVQLFLFPTKEIKFGALIPKDTYATLCILGKDIGAKTVGDFIEHPVVKGVLPNSVPYKLDCRCLPKMNIRAPKKPFADRIVACGDAGSTRLFKDGIGAAYIMGKAAAKTAVLHGVGRGHFSENYYPVYRSIVTDNLFGRFLFAVTDIYRKSPLLSKEMLAVVSAEQKRGPGKPRVLSSILWDMFTGNERYKNVFFRTLDIGMNLDQGKALIRVLLRRDHGRG